MNPEPTNFVEQIRVRHSLLVDKKFLEGLTSEEADELTQINRFLDAAEEKYYAPIKKTLAAIKEHIVAVRDQLTNFYDDREAIDSKIGALNTLRDELNDLKK